MSALVRGHLGVAVPECITVRFTHFISDHPGAACTQKFIINVIEVN